jgi:L-ascorbate metabolism protein UlaG (beta-lactamase superfamily)
MIDNIKWLGHGSFVIEGVPLIYIDPWKVPKRVFHPDAILISHDHYEHFSQADIAKLRGPNTLVIGNQSIVDQVDEAILLRPWQSISVQSASIKAIPAYSSNSVQHSPQLGGLGYVISLNLHDIYYAGDTGITPEIELIHPDIAILPIDDNGTMSVEEAAQVIRKMRPRWVLPSNVSSPHGATLLDARQLKNLVQDYTQVILPE